MYLEAADDTDRKSYMHPHYPWDARLDGSGFPNVVRTLGSAQSTRMQFEEIADTAHLWFGVPLVGRLPHSCRADSSRHRNQSRKILTDCFADSTLARVWDRSQQWLIACY